MQRISACLIILLIYGNQNALKYDRQLSSKIKKKEETNMNASIFNTSNQNTF